MFIARKWRVPRNRSGSLRALPWGVAYWGRSSCTDCSHRQDLICCSGKKSTVEHKHTLTTATHTHWSALHPSSDWETTGWAGKPTRRSHHLVLWEPSKWSAISLRSESNCSSVCVCVCVRVWHLPVSSQMRVLYMDISPSSLLLPGCATHTFTVHTLTHSLLAAVFANFPERLETGAEQQDPPTDTGEDQELTHTLLLLLDTFTIKEENVCLCVKRVDSPSNICLITQSKEKKSGATGI